MFKDLGERFKNGTICLTITMHEGEMAVMVTFKNLPAGIHPMVMRGTPEEIEENFIDSLEQPLSMASAYNVKMNEFEELLKASLENKKKEVDKAVKPETKKPSGKTKSTQTTITEAPKTEVKKEAAADEPEDLEINLDVTETKEPAKEDQKIVNVRLNEKQKNEIIQAGVDNRDDAANTAIAKLVELKNIDKESATVYFDNNLKEPMEQAIKELADKEAKHAANVAKMKQEAETGMDEDFDPFADDEPVDESVDEDDDFDL